MGIVGGGRGGSGFQLFTQANGTSGVYADAAARDVYFNANPSELARLDANEFLIIKLLDDGAGKAAYQQYVNPVWVDVTSLVQGETGPAGATGNSYFFKSITSRDDFFSTPGNEGLLENGLPISVNVGDDTTSNFVWGGGTSPPSYDSTLWRLSALEVSSGTLYLGESGANISSGSEVMNFISAGGVNHYFHGISYDDTGSNPPAYWKLPALTQIPLADVSTSTLSDPQTLGTTNTLNLAVKEYTLIPATSGELRVQTWLGTDETGPSIVDTFITVAPGDVGNQTVFQAPNNTFVLVGQATYTKFSGVQLKGGLQTLPPFSGQTVPFVTLGAWIAEQFEFVTQFDDTLNLKSQSPTGTASIEYTNSSDVSKGTISYNENTDELSVSIGDTTSIFSIKNPTSPDTDELILLATGGTNGASANLHVGIRTPEGNVTATAGSLYIRNNLANSTIYIKRTNTGNTGWYDALDQGDVDGPASATDSAIAVFDGTTGKLIKGISTATLKQITNDTELTIQVAGTNGFAGIPILNSTGTTKAQIVYEEAVDDLDITTFGTTDIRITSGEALVLRCPATNNLDITNTDATISLDTNNRIVLSSTNPDTSEGFLLEQTSTNGGSVGVYVGNRDPEGNVTANTGDIYIRDDGTSSTIYVKRASGTTGWFNLEDAGVTTPGSSTDNAIVLWNGTGGDNIDENSNLTVTSSASELYIRMRNPSATGIVGTLLVNSSNVIDGELSYDEQNNNVRLIAYNSADIGIDSSGDVDIDTPATGRIQLQVLNKGTHTITSGGVFQWGSILADTSHGYSFRQNGANGGFSGWHIGIRNPEGNVTADGGDLYIRDAGTSSAVYLKKTDTVNTGWSKLADADDLITTPGSTTDNAIVLWNGTGGDNIDYDAKATIGISGNDLEINLTAPVATGKSRTTYRDNTGLNSVAVGYDGNLNEGFISCNKSNSAFSLKGKGLVNITTTATNDVQLSNTKAFIIADSSGECRFISTNADTTQAFLFEQTGSNGGTSRWHVGIRDPNGNVTGNGGDFYIRDSGVNSTIYVKKVDGGTTGWTDVTASSFDDINWTASVNRRYSDGRRTQNIGTAYSIYDAPTRNLQTTAGKLVPNVSAGTIQILDIDDTTNGDLYEVMFTGSLSCLTGYDIYMRIVAFDGTNRVGYLGSVDDNSIQVNDIYSNGSNFPQNISMVGIIRGPSSFVGGGTPGLRVEVRNTTASGQIFTNSCNFSARRIK